MPKNKMKVEVWSDIMCPFCYLGKRKFENALAQFSARDNVEVVWKSFQLAPDMKTDTTLNIHQYLAKAKGFPLAQAQQLNDRVTGMARQVGLVYNFDKAVVANSFRAHCFLHFAKQQGRQNEAKERLLKAYFTDGMNIDDVPTLLALGSEIGLDADALSAALESGAFADAVRADIHESQQLGIQGVPFFVLDRKYGVSGAQETPVFLQALEQAYGEWKGELNLELSQGPACTPDGVCE